MKTIVTVVGARPQFIKASVVSHALQACKHLNELVVHTGQHYDANMSEVFFAELGMVEPAYYLGISGGDHGAMTGRMLVEIEKLLIKERPAAVLVYGDTNSTLAGALAAVKLQIPVAHVEAGLRSFNMAMPEEVNRIVTDRISRWLFAPTETAEMHLRREGARHEQVLVVGDVMYDAALHHGARAGVSGRVLDRLGLSTGNYVLATVHRAENTENLQRLGAIVAGLVAVTGKLPVIWPLHPRTRAVLQNIGNLAKLASQIKIVDPVSYLEMVELERNAAVIATDSGGVQKEAFFYGVPCVTMRRETEWTELVDAGWNRLAPPDSEGNIRDAVLSAIGSRGMNVHPYGTGNAAVRIVERLHSDLDA